MNIMLLHPRRLLAVLLFLFCGQAMAGLMVTPTRLVFEKNQRALQVQLVNTGTERVTYRVRLVNRRMGELGELLAADTAGPGELFAVGLLQYAPRQVTLEPGVGQTVRVMVRKPAELADGEYRSHLLFETIPDPGAASVENADSAAGEFGVQVKVTMGATIPVIVRHGSLQSAVTLATTGVQGAPGAEPALGLRFERSGGASVYGDLSVFYVGRDGAEKAVARMAGLAVYTPNTVRQVKVPLQMGGQSLSKGTLRAVFRARADAGGAVLAQSELPLP